VQPRPATRRLRSSTPTAQDAAEAEVRLDEALSYAATLLMWREAIK
jgi:hypothetical protein